MQAASPLNRAQREEQNLTAAQLLPPCMCGTWYRGKESILKRGETWLWPQKSCLRNKRGERSEWHWLYHVSGRVLHFRLAKATQRAKSKEHLYLQRVGNLLVGGKTQPGKGHDEPLSTAPFCLQSSHEATEHFAPKGSQALRKRRRVIFICRQEPPRSLQICLQHKIWGATQASRKQRGEGLIRRAQLLPRALRLLPFSSFILSELLCFFPFFIFFI